MFKIKLKLRECIWIPGLEGKFRDGDKFYTEADFSKIIYTTKYMKDENTPYLRLTWSFNKNHSNYKLSDFINYFNNGTFKKVEDVQD